MWCSLPSLGSEACVSHLLLSPGKNSVGPNMVPGAGQEKSKASSRLKVFIVEDERLIAENLKFIVEEKNMSVVGIASSGEEAIRRAQQSRPDLILMDIRIMGEVDGIGAAKIIQEIFVHAPRILFLSAHSKDQFPQLNALTPDSFSYLKKPYTPEDVIAAIELLLSQFQNS